MRTLLLRHHAPVGLQIANAESALLPFDAISVDFAASGTGARGHNQRHRRQSLRRRRFDAPVIGRLRNSS